MSELRTVTYNVKMNIEGAKTGAKNVQITMKTMEQDTKKAEVSLSKLAKTIGDKVNVQTKVMSNDVAIAAAALRQSTKETNKNAIANNSLVKEYAHLTSKIGKTVDQQEILNAQYRLGSKATMRQQADLEDLIRTYQKQRNVMNKGQGSMRGFRGQMQNIGYQAQDVAVQMQMGTNAMVIFSQQGSQLAAGFGPTGAIVGAGIAFAGMIGSLLLPNLFKAGESIDTLVEKLKVLAKTTGLTKERASVLIADQEKQLKGNQKEVDSITSKVLAYTLSAKTYSRYRDETIKYNSVQSKMIGGNLKMLKSEQQWQASLRGSDVEQSQRIAKLQGFSEAVLTARKNINLINSAIGVEGTNAAKKYKDSSDKLVTSLNEQADQLGKNRIELLEMRKVQALSALASKNSINLDKDAARKAITAAFDRVIAGEKLIITTNKQAKATAKSLIVESKRIAVNASLVKGIDEQAAVVGKNRIEVLELKKAQALLTLTTNNGTDAQKNAVIEDYNAIIAGEKLIQNIKAQDKADTNAAKAKSKRDNDQAKATAELLKSQQQRNSVSKRIGDDDGQLAALTAKHKTEQELFKGNKKALELLEIDYQKNIIGIQGSALEQYLVSVESQLNDFDALAANSIESFTQGFGDAVGSAVVGAESIGDAMKGIFEGLVQGMVSFFAEWAAQEAAMFLLKKFYTSGAQANAAATTSLNATAMATQAALNAFASTAAIPVVGPALAPAAATAALAVTTPMASAVSSTMFAGVFDKGGNIPQGSMGIMSEYGDELANGVLVKGGQGGTNVTSRADTAKLMSNSSSNSYSININSSGNATPSGIARALIRATKKRDKNLDNAINGSNIRGTRNAGRR